MYQYPQSDLDSPSKLLEAIGSLWSSTYDNGDMIESLLVAIAAAGNQELSDFYAMLASISRKSIPVTHLQQIQPVVLIKSQKDQNYGIPTYGDGISFFDGSTRFDTPYNGTILPAYPAPAGMVAAPVIVNRLTNTSRTLICNVDYWLKNGMLIFRDDPFNDPLCPKIEVMSGSQVVDMQCSLWILRGQFDRDAINQQFGYAMNLNAPSTPAGKDFVNAMFDALVDGSAFRHLYRAWSAIAGVPLCQSDGEIVQLIVTQPDRLIVITDQQVYSFNLAATPIVNVGDTLRQYQPLTDALMFFEFNRGQVPAYQYVKGLSLSRGWLLADFYADLIFRNVSVPITSVTDDDGFVKVSFEVDGFPGDVSLFFDLLHERGVNAGYTLANLLDTRPAAAKSTDPNPPTLPATINPLQFLCQNVLRNNVMLVRLKTVACAQGVGITAAKALRMVIPPQCAMIVLAELTYADPSITMNGPGTPEAPGYSETQAVFLGNLYSEGIDPSFISESVRIFQVGGRCA